MMIFAPFFAHDGVSSLNTFASPVYNADGTLASAVINGVSHTFTYAGGKIATIERDGETRTYTWSGDQLLSVAVS